MSKFVGDDMELRSETGRVYMVNYQTNEAYDGRVSERYFEMKEREAVYQLTALANTILARVEHEDRTDCRIETETHLLRRQSLPIEIDGRALPNYVYWYVDRSVDQGYYRSWTADGDAVHWCKDDGEYEPADDVAKRIVEAFPLPERPVAQRRSFGVATCSLLAKLRLTR